MFNEIINDVDNALTQLAADGYVSSRSFDRLEHFFMACENLTPMDLTDDEKASLSTSILEDLKAEAGALHAMYGHLGDTFFEVEGPYEAFEANLFPLWREFCGVHSDFNQKSYDRTEKIRSEMAERTAGLDLSGDTPESLEQLAEVLGSMMIEAHVAREMDHFDDEVSELFEGDK